MSKIEDKIAAAEAKLKQLKALKQKESARKRAEEAKKARTQDTRRKILAGSLVLEMMEKDPEVKARLMARLNTFLTRPDDRALFDLEAVPAAPAPAGHE